MKNFLLVFIGLIIGIAICTLACKRTNLLSNEPMFKGMGLQDSTKAKKFRTFAVQVPPDQVKSFIIRNINNSGQFTGIKLTKGKLLQLIDSVTRYSGSDSIRIVIGGIGGAYPNQQIILQSGKDDAAATGTCVCMNPCCPWPKGPLNISTIAQDNE